MFRPLSSCPFRVFFLFLPALFLVSCGTSDTPAPYRHFGQNGGADSAGVHTVSGGDTLWSIAQRYDLAMPDIIYVNKMSAPYMLETGQRLKLPPPNRYKVKPADTLYNISRLFSVSMNQIAQQNDMRPPYTIHPGQVLKLPAVRPAVATPAGKPPVRAAAAQKPIPRPVRKAVAAKVPPRAGGKFAWPADGPVISSYGPKPGGLHNDGINIKAARGAPVRAAENGVVVYADNQLQGYGNLVLVRHEDRWMTAYAHLDSAQVRRGQKIMRGDIIGRVGSSGAIDSPQLHFEVRRGTKAINPMLYLARQGS